MGKIIYFNKSFYFYILLLITILLIANILRIYFTINDFYDEELIQKIKNIKFMYIFYLISAFIETFMLIFVNKYFFNRQIYLNNISVFLFFFLIHLIGKNWFASTIAGIIFVVQNIYYNLNKEKNRYIIFLILWIPHYLFNLFSYLSIHYIVLYIYG